MKDQHYTVLQHLAGCQRRPRSAGVPDRTCTHTAAARPETMEHMDFFSSLVPNGAGNMMALKFGIQFLG